jgi:hypothetical protein
MVSSRLLSCLLSGHFLTNKLYSFFVSSVRADQNGADYSGSSTVPQDAWEPYIWEMFDPSEPEIQINNI